MSQNIFKIYDGRTNFWQWDTKQKLIVLDPRVTEVRFSNRNMEHSKRRPVYTDNDGVRICNVPDLLLQLPKTLPLILVKLIVVPQRYFYLLTITTIQILLTSIRYDMKLFLLILLLA